MYNTIYQCLSNPVVYCRWQALGDVLRGAARAAVRAASVANFFYIEAERLIDEDGKVDQRRLKMLADAEAKWNLEMLSNAAATAAATNTTVADDKDSRKEASSTESAGLSLEHVDKASKHLMDPETARLLSLCAPPRKEESVTEPTGPSPTYRGEVQAYDQGTDPIPGEMHACPTKSSDQSDDGFPGTPPPEDSATKSDAPPAEVSSKTPDLADEDNSSYSSEEEGEIGYDPDVAKAAKRRASQTSAAGGKP